MQARPWYLDEHIHAGSEHLDESYVEAYDHKAQVDPAEDLVLLERLGLDEAKTLIDLGTGTGTLALAAALSCRFVVAVDVSPAMLALARTKALQQAIANITFVQAGFLSYVHDREPADFVYSRNALHHLSDFWKALALSHIAAMLRPGGVFVLRDLVFSCEPHEIAEVVDAWLTHAPDSPDAGWTRRELEAHLRTEHSTFSWLLEPLLERTGFALSDIHYDASRVFATYICTRRR